MTFPAASEPNITTRICVAANFTIEPIEQVLTYWLDQLGIPADLQFAPYNQVFQQLLEGGLLRTNTKGINLVGLELDGWLVDGPLDEATAQLDKTVTEFLGVLRGASSQGVSGAVLLFPLARGLEHSTDRQGALAKARESIVCDCASIAGWSAIDLNGAV